MTHPAVHPLDTRSYAELCGHAPTPEYLQRNKRARDFNVQLAARRLLDRETYRGLRKYVRIPADQAEADRNDRWAIIRNALQSQRSCRWTVPHCVKLVRSMREARS